MTGMYNTYYDINRATLWGEKVDGQEHTPSLVLSVANGNPRFVAYGGVKGVIINFPCNVHTMGVIFDLIKTVAKSEPGTTYQVTSESYKWVDNKRTNEMEVRATLVIGKTKKGICYLMIKAKDKPDIPFALRSGVFHQYTDKDGAPLPEDELSARYAISLADTYKNTLSGMLLQYAKDSFKHGDFKPGVIGQRFNDNNRSKGSNKALASSSVDLGSFDEDIPF